MTDSAVPSPTALRGGALPPVPSGPRHAETKTPTALLLERVRANADSKASRGITRIADDVVAKVVTIAAREVAGVYDLGGDVTRAFAAARDRAGTGGGGSGVAVRLRERQVEVDVAIVVAYGHVVMEVADAVRANVIAALERMFGMQVTEVNVAIDDVHVPDRKEK